MRRVDQRLRHLAVDAWDAEVEAGLEEESAVAGVIEATGLGAEFPTVQKTVTRLRDNLLRAAEAPPPKT